MILAQLGPITFGISKAAYQELTRLAEYRWPKMERLGVRPARQWIGVGDDTLNLRGIVYPVLGGGRWTIEDMREAASMGIPYDFIDGTGHVWGKYCIESVRETQSVFLSNGAPRKQEFDLQLGAYGDDELSGMVIVNGNPVSGRTGVGSGLDGNTGAGNATA